MDPNPARFRVKRASESASLPVRQHEGDAGYDLTATSKSFNDKEGVYEYGTGIHLEVPTGHVGLLAPRSSIASRGLVLSNSIGVIDSGYRGEILFKFTPIKEDHYPYELGDRIGQLLLVPVATPPVREVYDLASSDRSSGGWGSTGK